MRALVVTVIDERYYHAAHREDHGRWWRWLTDTLQADPAKMHITKVVLGEGTVTLFRFCDPLTVIDGEVQLFTETHPAPTPPPCWPVGLEDLDAD